jgi:hypothetical protein
VITKHMLAWEVFEAVEIAVHGWAPSAGMCARCQLPLIPVAKQPGAVAGGEGPACFTRMELRGRSPARYSASTSSRHYMACLTASSSASTFCFMRVFPAECFCGEIACWVLEALSTLLDVDVGAGTPALGEGAGGMSASEAGTRRTLRGPGWAQASSRVGRRRRCGHG